MHSPIRANRYPLATITGAQRASGQTHSRARSHQDDADLRADRSTAYLVSCIRVRSAFYHLVGTGEQRGWYIEAESLGGLHIDDQFELRRLQHWYVCRFGSLENPIHKIPGSIPEVGKVNSVSNQPANLREVNEAD
jgi:hypothetical protein